MIWTTILALSILQLCLLSLSQAANSYDITNALRRLTLPHNCPPGHVVTTAGFVGQTLSLAVSLVTSKHSMDWTYCLSNDCHNVTQHFTVLSNGEVVTLSEISNLLGRELLFRVDSELGTESWNEEFLVQVRDGNTLLMFTQSVYEGHISENLPPFSSVRDIEGFSARVGNRRASVRYAIIDGPQDLFEIFPSSPVSGVIPSIRTLSGLDYEQESQYNIIVMASTERLDDQPAFAKVIVFVSNVNDNFPQMDRLNYSAIVADDIMKLSQITRITASDADSDRLSYHLEDDSDEFGINPKNGDIYLLKASWKLVSDSYELRVFAADANGKRSPSAVVNLLIKGSVKSSLLSDSDSARTDRKRRELRPVKYAEVAETFVTGDVIDLDHNYYEVFSFKDPAPKMLELNPTMGSVRLRSGERFDYEAEKEIEFVIQITRIDNPSCKYFNKVYCN